MEAGRLNTITLRAGAAPDAPPRLVEVGPVTVVVGPNNGGKSTLLRDLAEFASHAARVFDPNFPNSFRAWPGGSVVGAASVGLPEGVSEVAAFLEAQAAHSPAMRGTMFSVTGGAAQLPPMPDDFSALFERGEAPLVGLMLLSRYVLSLGGRQRFALAQAQESGPLNDFPTSHWMAIERDRRLYEAVDEMISSAFDRHLALQTFNRAQLTPALGNSQVPEGLWQSTSQEALELQAQSQPLTELSDGVQVFCGLAAAVVTLPYLLLLIDEPEAFLHPTLSRRLGADLARITRMRDARMVAATHSVDFLLGCIDEVPETTVLRVGFGRGVASSHVIDAAEVARLGRDPLLRSTNALRALFAETAVVCEADSDRAFYEEINRRLLSTPGFSGAKDAEFINAQNWQTTAKIAAPLRAAGVPTAVVLDLDTLARDDTWSSLIEMACLSDADKNRLLGARASAGAAIKAAGSVDSDGPLIAKVRGLSGIEDDSARGTVQGAIDSLATIGIFVVDVGELERWLPQFRCTNKQTWVTDMFGCLGAASEATYVPPANADVWAFVGRIAHWLNDAHRAGMPQH